MERIDTHCHFVSPCWRQELDESSLKKPAPQWSEESHLDFMAKTNISKSILSITDPGTDLVFGADPERARKLSRDCNVFAADLKKRRPNQFGFWAALPLSDIEGSLQELAYAFDELDSDGVCLMTNYHGKYLGDPAFDPVFEELNRCNGQPQSAMPLPSYGPAMFEFLFDEARVVINLLSYGLTERFSNIKIIIPHCGGTLPPLLERFTGISKAFARMGIRKSNYDLSDSAVHETLSKQFYFDLAGFPFPNQIHGLLRHVGVNQLLYGSDYCYTPGPLATELAVKMDIGMRKLFHREESVAKVYRLNAEALLARKRIT